MVATGYWVISGIKSVTVVEIFQCLYLLYLLSVKSVYCVGQLDSWTVGQLDLSKKY